MAKNETKGVKCICDYAMTPNSLVVNKPSTATTITKPWRRTRPGDPNNKVQQMSSYLNAYQTKDVFLFPIY